MSTNAVAVSIQRPGSGRGRGQVAATPVGDYVGQSAAQAARAVRRAGLRPSLDRAFGSDPELTGRIVAQDPIAGSGLVRNAMVTLYVAAPGSPQLAETAELGIRDGDQTRRPVRRVDTWAGTSASSLTRTSAGRARKPRPTRGPGAEHPSTVSCGRTPAAGGDPKPAWVAFTGPTRPPADLDGGVGNMFAGAEGELPPWRRAYPRRPMRAVLRRPLRWLRSHPILAPSAGAMIGLWIVVAIAGNSAPGGVRDARRVVSERGSSIAAAQTSRPARSRAAKTVPQAAPVPKRTRRSERSPTKRTASRRRRDQTRTSVRVLSRPSRTNRAPYNSSPVELPARVASAPMHSPAFRPSGGPFSP